MKDIPNNIHFVGIGGAGMSGIARILAGLGYHISGSDINASVATEKLAQLGVHCLLGHRKENLQGAEMVVISTAIPEDNPELIRARELGLPILHRGEMLAKLMSRQQGIAVAGSHGKTTTTAMLALVLEKSNLDPTIVIGGNLSEIGSNAKLGTGHYLVAEADESDGSFLMLQPQYAIVTNIEDDHMDYYGSAANILTAFKKFVNKISADGLAILWAGDVNIQQITPQLTVPFISYGTEENADYRLKNMVVNGTVNGADVYHRDRLLGYLELGVPGHHNLLNALAVVVLALHVGLSFNQVASILKEFKGAERRYQLLGDINDIKVIDDYAHHPTEIKATLQGARQTNPKRLIGIFQPHRYTRTKQLYERFGASFGDADLLVVSGIYSAGESPINGVTAELIVEAAKRHLVKEIVYIEDLTEVTPYLADIAQPGDLILTMGAGNIWTAGVDLVKTLKERY